MIGTLTLALLVALQDEPWPISQKVVQEIVVTMKGHDFIPYFCEELLESGHKEVAAQIWQTTGTHLDDPRYRRYQRDGNLKMMLDMASLAEYRRGDPPMPEPINEALYSRDERSVRQALAYVLHRRDAGLELNFRAWYSNLMGKDADTVTALCDLFLQEDMDEFAYTIALENLSEHKLSLWVQTFVDGLGGDVPGRYSESLQPGFNRFMDRAIARYPQLLSDSDLFRLTDTIQPPRLMTLVTQKLLNDPVPNPISERSWGSEYYRALAIQHATMFLADGGRFSLARDLLVRHRRFLYGAFEWAGVYTIDGWARSLTDLGRKRLATDLASAVEKGFRREQDRGGYIPTNHLPWVMSLFYESGGLEPAETFCKLVESSSQGSIVEMRSRVAELMFKDRKHDEAMQYVFSEIPKYAYIAIYQCLKYAGEHESEGRVQEIAKEAVRLMIKYGEFYSYRLTQSLRELQMTEQLRDLAQSQYPLPINLYTAEEALDAGFKYASAGMDIESLAFFELAFAAESDNLGDFVGQWGYETRVSHERIMSIGDGKLFNLYLEHLGAYSAVEMPEAVTWDLILLLRFCQDDPSKVEKILSALKELIPVDRERNRNSYERFFLMALLRGGDRYELGQGYFYDPPFSVRIQDLVLKVIVDSRSRFPLKDLMRV